MIVWITSARRTTSCWRGENTRLPVEDSDCCSGEPALVVTDESGASVISNEQEQIRKVTVTEVLAVGDVHH